jgi:hypothetical protein
MAELRLTSDNKYVCLQDLASVILKVKRPTGALNKLANDPLIGPALVMVKFPRMYKAHFGADYETARAAIDKLQGSNEVLAQLNSLFNVPRDKEPVSQALVLANSSVSVVDSSLISDVLKQISLPSRKIDLKRKHAELDCMEKALKMKKDEMWMILDIRNEELSIESKRLKQDLDRFEVLRQQSILRKEHPNVSCSIGRTSSGTSVCFTRKTESIYMNAFEGTGHTLGPYSLEAVRDFAERENMPLSSAGRVDLEQRLDDLLERENMPLKTSVTGLHLYPKGSLEEFVPVVRENKI